MAMDNSIENKRVLNLFILFGTLHNTSRASAGRELGMINPLTPMSDQDRISPYNIKQTSHKNKEK